MQERARGPEEGRGNSVKPHEEKWETGEGVLSGALYNEGIWIGSFTNAERARLAAKAPELVRHVLMSIGACEGCGGSGTTSVRTPTGRYDEFCPTCEDARAVLKAAGVIP
jgi:hypothetical protein